MDEHTLKVERGTVLGWACIFVLVALQVAALLAGPPAPGEPQTGLAVVLIGVMFVALGAMLLTSYYFPHKSFFFRGLLWLAERGGRPPTKKWVFFWVVLTLVGGSIAILRGLGVPV